MICLDDDHDMFGWMMMMMMMMMMTTTVIKQEYLTLNTMMIILSLSTAAQATYSTFFVCAMYMLFTYWYILFRNLSYFDEKKVETYC